MLDYIQIVQAGEHPRTYREIVSNNRLWWLLPDDLLPAKYRKARPNETQGFPQTVNITTQTETIPLTRELQEFIFALNTGLARTAFSGILDTWNKGSKVRDSADFINHERENMELPKLPTDLLFGCNVVREVKRFTWRSGQGIDIGEDVIEIEHIDPNNLPDPETLPVWLKHHLTIIHPAQYNGHKKVNPFPQNSGNPCFTAIISKTAQYIETARCMQVMGAIPFVYNPPR